MTVEGTMSEKGLSRKENVVIVLMSSLITLTSSMATSLVLPILPEFLDAMGLQGQLITGFVFSIMPATIIFLSPLCNWMAKKLGRTFLLYFGVPLQAAASLAFGFAPLVAGGKAGLLIAIFLITRALQGFGTACANLAQFAIVTDSFDTYLGRVMGINEVMTGLGFMLGPIIGSVLYDSSGFSSTFIVADVMLLLSLPLIVVYDIQRRRRERIGEEEGEGEDAHDLEEQPAKKEDDTEEKSFWQQIKQVLGWRIMLTCIILLIGTGFFGWSTTVLSLHLLNDLHVEQKFVGLVFAAPSITTIVVGPFAGALADFCGYKRVLVSGVTFSGVLLMLVGPLSSLIWGSHLRQRLIWEAFFLALSGVSQCSIMAAALPAMRDCVPKKRAQNAGATNTIVMLMNQFQEAGMIFAPPLAGALGPLLGFGKTYFVYGLVMIATGVVSALAFGIHGGVPKEDDRSSEGSKSYFSGSKKDIELVIQEQEESIRLIGSKEEAS